MFLCTQYMVCTVYTIMYTVYRYTHTCIYICMYVVVCVCVCGVYVVYEDTNLYNNMGMT